MTVRLDNNPLKEVESLLDLKPNHKARKYVEDRKIPERYYKELYYCSEFKDWTNSIIPDKFSSLDYDEERLIIPFFSPLGKMYGYQGRLISPDSPRELRYISIMIDELQPKIWGWNNVDFNRPYYVVEGPLDGMFLENGLATAGGKISQELLKINGNIDNAVICYDNEPRSPHTVDKTWKAVQSALHVVIWPSDFQPKDINDMRLAGYTEKSINQLLRECTFKGLDAQLQFTRWKRI